ncbi:hypothetical protein [Streptomyces sp. NPDC001889]
MRRRPRSLAPGPGRGVGPGHPVALPPGHLLCSFRLVEVLVFIGRRDEAETLFGRLLALSSALGLQEWDPV